MCWPRVLMRTERLLTLALPSFDWITMDACSAKKAFPERDQEVVHFVVLSHARPDRICFMSVKSSQGAQRALFRLREDSRRRDWLSRQLGRAGMSSSAFYLLASRKVSAGSLKAPETDGFDGAEFKHGQV